MHSIFDAANQAFSHGGHPFFPVLVTLLLTDLWARDKVGGLGKHALTSVFSPGILPSLCHYQHHQRQGKKA
jgi:hypothetical protein